MIETARLRLLPYRPRHRDALIAMFGDAETMKDLAPVKTPEMTDATVARHESYRPLGFWVVERREDGALTGYCGLKPGAPDTPIEGMLEIGWIIARPFWRQGYALEAAQASLDWAWANRADVEVVAITAQRNVASQKMMERLGMRARPDMDFDHPAFADDPGRRRTVTYSIDRPA